MRTIPFTVKRAPLGPFLLAAVATLALPFLLGTVRLNLSPSMPIGFYSLTPFFAGASRGDLVVACLPLPLARDALANGYLRPGSCSSGAAPVLKLIGAVSGDSVALSAEGLMVNGVPLPNTAPLTLDHAGRSTHWARLPPVVPRGRVLLYASYSPNSWDSRYFGLLPEAAVLARAQPLATTARRSSH